MNIKHSLKRLKRARRIPRAGLLLLGALFSTGSAMAQFGQPPTVTNVTTLVAGTGNNTTVTINYDVADPDSTNLGISVYVSQDGGASWTLPAKTFAGAWGPNITPGIGKSITWSAGADWPYQYTTNCRVRVLANDDGNVLIPAGSYLRGNPPSLGDSDISDAPQYSVYVSAFYMDPYLVSGRLWSWVMANALTNGYSFENSGDISKGPAYPVETINWLDAVKWCNARSEMLGLTPVYYTDGTFATVLKTGAAGSTTPVAKPNANGYRLPTEAEWEKAARGGVIGHRFPWSDADFISDSRANYHGNTNDYNYDSGPNGYNATYATGPQPYTSPVGVFSSNGYGLYDMAGNLFEWCSDLYGDSYYSPGQNDPQGPSTSPNGFRVLRGGSWSNDANYGRCAQRASIDPSNVYNTIGFRCVRGL